MFFKGNKSYDSFLGNMRKIIDFHTHPYVSNDYNICKHYQACNMTFETTLYTMKNLGVNRICGSVISISKQYATEWDKVKDWNEQALILKERYEGFYIPGFHIHPNYVEESIAEIDKMSAHGINLIGELVPYLNGYSRYNTENMNCIIDYAAKKNMVVSLHTMKDEEDLDAFVQRHQDIKIVAAHPGEYDSFMRHMSRMKMSENYYLDLSGSGMFRYGMLRRAIDMAGVEKILYGSDYPTCNPPMYLGGILLDNLIMEEEKDFLLYKNAERILR